MGTSQSPETRGENMIPVSSRLRGKDFDGATSDNVRHVVYREFKMAVGREAWFGNAYISGCYARQQHDCKSCRCISEVRQCNGATRLLLGYCPTSA